MEKEGHLDGDAASAEAAAEYTAEELKDVSEKKPGAEAEGGYSSAGETVSSKAKARRRRNRHRKKKAAAATTAVKDEAETGLEAEAGAEAELDGKKVLNDLDLQDERECTTQGLKEAGREVDDNSAGAAVEGENVEPNPGVDSDVWQNGEHGTAEKGKDVNNNCIGDKSEPEPEAVTATRMTDDTDEMSESERAESEVIDEENGDESIGEIGADIALETTAPVVYQVVQESEPDTALESQDQDQLQMQGRRQKNVVLDSLEEWRLAEWKRAHSSAVEDARSIIDEIVDVVTTKVHALESREGLDLGSVSVAELAKELMPKLSGHSGSTIQVIHHSSGKAESDAESEPDLDSMKPIGKEVDAAVAETELEQEQSIEVAEAHDKRQFPEDQTSSHFVPEEIEVENEPSLLNLEDVALPGQKSSDGNIKTKTLEDYEACFGPLWFEEQELQLQHWISAIPEIPDTDGVQAQASSSQPNAAEVDAAVAEGGVGVQELGEGEAEDKGKGHGCFGRLWKNIRPRSSSRTGPTPAPGNSASANSATGTSYKHKRNSLQKFYRAK